MQTVTISEMSVMIPPDVEDVVSQTVNQNAD
jgi:hypothetical protein